MTKAQYVGVNGVARKVKQPYVGINGVARKIIKGYVGVNGVARQYFGPLWKPTIINGSTFITPSLQTVSNGLEVKATNNKTSSYQEGTVWFLFGHYPAGTNINMTIQQTHRPSYGTTYLVDRRNDSSIKVIVGSGSILNGNPGYSSLVDLNLTNYNYTMSMEGDFGIEFAFWTSSQSGEYTSAIIKSLTINGEKLI